MAKNNTTFALSTDGPSHISIWAKVLGTNPDGSVLFECLNGAWEGTWHPSKNQVLFGTNNTLYATKVWEGVVPKEHRDDYNGALIWIRTQVKGSTDAAGK